MATHTMMLTDMRRRICHTTAGGRARRGFGRGRWMSGRDREKRGMVAGVLPGMVPALKGFGLVEGEGGLIKYGMKLG